MQDCRVAAAGHDRVEGKSVGTATEELGFEADLDLVLRLPLGDQLVEQEKARSRCLLRVAHPSELDVVLDATDVRERIAEIVVEASVQETPRTAAPRQPQRESRRSSSQRASSGASWTPSGDACLSVFGAGPGTSSSRVTGASNSNQPSSGSNARTPPGRSRGQSNEVLEWLRNAYVRSYLPGTGSGSAGADDNEPVREVPRRSCSHAAAVSCSSADRRQAVGHLLIFAGQVRARPDAVAENGWSLVDKRYSRF